MDEAMAAAILRESAIFRFDREAHLRERSLEVCLPFLQTVLGNFRIVPILVGDANPKNTAKLARAIARYARDKNTLLVATTDLSQNHSYEEANAID